MVERYLDFGDRMDPLAIDSLSDLVGPPGSEARVSRRSFLQIAGAAAAAVLATGCRAGPKDNTSLASHLGDILGVDETTTREEFTKVAAPLFLDPSWMTNSDLGEYKNTRGEEIALRTLPNGELDYAEMLMAVDGRSEVRYLSPPSVNISEFSFDETLKDGTTVKNRLYAYGPLGVTDELDRLDKEKVMTFLQQIFAGSKAETNTLHLNFCPTTTDVPFMAEERIKTKLEGKAANSQSGSADISGMMSQGDENTIVYQTEDILINLSRLHFDSEELVGMPLQDTLVNYLANEMVGMNIKMNLSLEDLILLNNMEDAGNLNESVTTIAGILAAVDEQFARTLLGGDGYNYIFEKVAEQMVKLKKLGEK